ncbi:AraC family transcriptional regulator [Myxosarcina sp. GI1]|uniref:helix-turn-helix domain-containing protein n=1 Tax=Myxosarcina sp. GI1 TaxID=1541065 RepID=UPI0009DE2C62|nr:AraC family transcriptional regulator [Myxosarcina sp. GI1]
MVNSANQWSETSSSQFSELTTPRQKNIILQHLQNPAGEGSCCFEGEHTVFISLAPRPIEYVQVQDGKTHTGLYQRGEILITPANTPLFVRWSGNEDCLQIQLTTKFLQSIAQETLDRDSDRLELIPGFQIRDARLEAIAMMLFTEHQQDHFDNGLYLDSLTNVLAVNLLRNHTASKPQFPIYKGGFSPRQLGQVLDYIDAYLDRNIKLADLAQLLGMSPFHFSRLFKQSIGMTPHQYLSQQRVERAKELLKKTDRLIIDIALECGFSSHSHLSKQFRQITGITPKAYRLG